MGGRGLERKRVKAADILYQRWEDLPFQRLSFLLKLIPLIDWDKKEDWMNTFCKNLALKNIFKEKKLYRITTAEQRVDLINHEMKWLREITHKFLIPSLYSLKAPKDGLTDITIERLAEADTRISRYLISGRESYMHTFLACLYQDDEPFSEENMLESAKKLAKVEPWKKISIIRSYMGSRMRMNEKLKELFPPGSTSTKKTLPSVKDSGPLWESLIHELANTPAYRGMETAKKANAWEALTYMDREIKKIKKTTK